MFRTALLRSTRQVTRAAPQCQAPISWSRELCPMGRTKNSIAPPVCARKTVRYYSLPTSLLKEEVEGRIMDLLKNFDKVTDSSKLNAGSHFSNDLGLDSLDTVEVVMAIEEEFSIEIPDKDADAIHSVKQSVDYIVAQLDAH